MYDDFITWYVGRRKRLTGIAPAQHTIRNKRSALNRVLHVLQLERVEDLEGALTERVRVEALLDALYARLAPGTVAITVQALIDYGEYVKARGAVETWAVSKDDMPRLRQSKVKDTYSPDEVEVLIGAARGVSVRYWAFVLTLAETGRRAGEVLGLEWSWLRLDTEPAHFTLPTSKNRKPQYVPLSSRLMREVYTPAMMDTVRACPSRKPFTRSPEVHPFPWTYESARRMFERLCERCGVPYKGGLHVLRHTKATALLTRGVPDHAVAALLGHSVQALQRTYDHSTSLQYARYLET